MTQPHPALLMAIAARDVEARVLAGVHAAGYDDLTPAQARIAARIDEGGSRLGVLAEAARVTKQSAAVAVDALEASGYVERRPDPADGRAKVIVLAPRGRKARAAAREVEHQIAAAWQDALGPARYAAMMDALIALRPHVDPWFAAPDGNELANRAAQA